MPRLKSKPAKPHPDFPLFPHATGRWAKKVRGKLHYFGAWADPDAALNKWIDQRDDLLAGRTPRVSGEGVTVRDLVNRFLTSKRNLLDSGEITAGTFGGYFATCENIVGQFGRTRLVDDLAADDFEALRVSLAKRLGPVALGNEVNRCRMVFKFAADQGLINRPIRYGQSFNRPSRKTLRVAGRDKGARLFSPLEIRRLVNAAEGQLKAMVLLGINCGLGNSDIASLPLSALNLKAGWLNYPRAKTGIHRRCPLWPETVDALKKVVENRILPVKSADADLVFLTYRGRRWVRTEIKTREGDEARLAINTTDALASVFGVLLSELGLRRAGLGFYALRHSFETHGGEAKDQIAVDTIMGHAPEAADMSAVYRHGVSDERLKAVTDHVRGLVFPARVVPKVRKATPR